MKIFKRLIVCLLIAALLPVNVTINAAAKEEGVSSYDVGIDLLKAIGVITDADLQRDSSELITRAELAMLAVRLRGWERLSHDRAETRYFYDVDPEYYETRYINLAVSTGLMTSAESGYFAPAKAVTFADAAKALMTVLGYKPLVAASGGADNDYLLLATQKGLLKGLEERSSSVNRGDIYQMLVNSLDVGVLKETAYGEKAKYRSVKDHTLLAEYHGIYTDEGIVTANESSALATEGGKAGKDKVEINGVLHYTDNSAYHDLLGYNVEYYYKADDNESELVYAYKRDNEELELLPSDITDFSNLKYTYFNEKEKEKTAKVTGAYFVYNGSAMSGNNDDFVPTSGHVGLIDNDNNGTYDDVKIYS